MRRVASTPAESCKTPPRIICLDANIWVIRSIDPYRVVIGISTILDLKIVRKLFENSTRKYNPRCFQILDQLWLVQRAGLSRTSWPWHSCRMRGTPRNYRWKNVIALILRLRVRSNMSIFMKSKEIGRSSTSMLLRSSKSQIPMSSQLGDACVKRILLLKRSLLRIRRQFQPTFGVNFMKQSVWTWVFLASRTSRLNDLSHKWLWLEERIASASRIKVWVTNPQILSAKHWSARTTISARLIFHAISSRATSSQL